MSAKSPPVKTDSWCYTEVEDDKVFTYAWTIERFEQVMADCPAGKTMYSDQFVIPLRNRNTIWRLKLYPNGRETCDQGNVTLFLKDSGHSEPANVKAFVKFSIIDSDGNKTNERTVDKEYKLLNHAFGFSKYLRHGHITDSASKLLVDGRITFHCEIAIRGSLGKRFKNRSSADNKDRLSDAKQSMSSLFHTQMLEMLRNPLEHFSDVEILCSDGKLDCHSSILAARSTVFKAMFSHPTKENESRKISMPDIEVSTCKKMLTFMYTGSLCFEKETDDTVDLNLVIAADKYDIQDLRDYCVMNFHMDITFDNAIQILMIADRLSISCLKNIVKKFIVSNSKELLKLPNWKQELSANPQLMAEILEDVISAPPPAKRRKLSAIVID